MQFIAPKNFKRGRLIANKYRLQDLLIASSLIAFSSISVIYYVFSSGTNSLIIAALLIPSGIAMLLLIPFEMHHNLLMYIELKIINAREQKKYIWGGISKNDIPEK